MQTHVFIKGLEAKQYLTVTNARDINFRQTFMVVYEQGQAWTGLNMCIAVQQDLDMGLGTLSGGKG